MTKKFPRFLAASCVLLVGAAFATIRPNDCLPCLMMAWAFNSLTATAALACIYDEV